MPTFLDPSLNIIIPDMQPCENCWTQNRILNSSYCQECLNENSETSTGNLQTAVTEIYKQPWNVFMLLLRMD